MERKLKDVEILGPKDQELLGAPDEAPPVQMPLRDVTR